MKVLQVNVVYKKGSTGKITYDLHRGLLDAGVESVVCYGRGELVKEPGVYKTCPEWYSKLNNAWSRVTGIMYGGCLFSTNRLISIIKKEKPVVVHLQCINGYFVNIYRIVAWLKNNHIKTVLTLHAEFMYTANCGHAYECKQWVNGCTRCFKNKQVTHSLLFDRTAWSYKKMREAFLGFEELTVVSVSPWVKDRAERSLILKGKRHNVIYNGVDTDVFHFRSIKKLGLKKDGRPVLLHVTADFNDPMKGGQYVLKLAKRMPDVDFIVIGSYQELENLPSNVQSIGRLSNQFLLAQYYSEADLTLVTSKRETYSMICAESLSCGTPVVGFKAGGPEQISLAEYSNFCEYGDLDALCRIVRSMILLGKNATLIEQTAHDVYSKERMCLEYLKTYNLYSNNGEK